MTTCPNCGGENSDQARFCQHCATPLAPATASRDVRKTVTVLFTDVTGSTSLGEQLDPESLRDVMGRYFDAARAVIERHGGTVEKFIGDAVMAVFGIPRLHEDDALRAVRAAMDLQQSLTRLNQELQAERGVTIATRTGVNTGEVVAGDPSSGQRLVTGDAVNVAARLEQAAQPGEILIAESTHSLVKDAVRVEPRDPLTLKGKAEPVAALALIEVIPQAAPYVRHLDSPMVGRTRELQLLRQAFDRTTSDRACQLFTILGAAGVGKSRLTEEFVGTATDHATIHRGRCLPYGEGITFWPVAEVVKQAAGIDEADSPEQARTRLDHLLEDERDAALITERLAQMIGLAEAQAMPEETFWAFRKLLEALARRQPLIVVIDDIHWAEPTLLDLIEHVADWTRDAPLLLLATARPELLDKRQAWGGGKLNATTVLLEPLSQVEADGLVENLLGAAALAPEARTRIVDAAEGNPLFVEQLVAMLIDDGHLVPEDGRWLPTTDLAAVKMPSSIQALLAARLDQLEEQERMAAERASIEGKIFHAGGVVALAPEAQKAHMRASLMGLVKKELIRPDDPELPGEDAFRFRHLLIRDAAYQAMPKQTRAELHERFADWLAVVAATREAEYEEILGYHLERAYRLRTELGPVDEGGLALARRAGLKLANAGRRAVVRGDGSGGINLLQRTVDLLPERDPARLDALLDLLVALTEAGHLDRAEEIAREGLRLAEEAGDERLRAHFQLGRVELEFYRPQPGFTEWAPQEIAAASGVFEALGDAAGTARAHRMRAFIHWLACSYSQAHDEAGIVLEYARQAGDERQAAETIDIMETASFWGPTPLAEAEAEAEGFRAYARAKGGRRLLLAAESNRARLALMSGRVDEARALNEERRKGLEDLGLALDATGRFMELGELELVAGNLDEAEAAFRQGYAGYEALGERGFNSTVSADLADVLAREGRLDEALEFVEASRRMAAEGDLASQTMWRWVRAMVLVESGQPEEAEVLAREAVELVGRTDSPMLRGPAWEALAEVLTRTGRRDEAVEALRTALGMYEAKGAVPHAENVRRRLADLEAGPR